jgi:hypothetical protein
MTPTFFLSHAARKASDVRRPFPIKGNIRTSEWTWGETAEGIHCPRNALTCDHYTPARSPHTFRCRILLRGTFFPRSTARAFSTCQLIDSTTPCARGPAKLPRVNHRSRVSYRWDETRFSRGDQVSSRCRGVQAQHGYDNNGVADKVLCFDVQKGDVEVEVHRQPY